MNYKVKIYVKKKTFAFLTIECDKEFVQDIYSQLMSTKTFIKILSVIINKEEIRYAKIIPIRQKA